MNGGGNKRANDYTKRQKPQCKCSLEEVVPVAMVLCDVGDHHHDGTLRCCRAISRVTLIDMQAGASSSVRKVAACCSAALSPSHMVVASLLGSHTKNSTSSLGGKLRKSKAFLCNASYFSCERRTGNVLESRRLPRMFLVARFRDFHDVRRNAFSKIHPHDKTRFVLQSRAFDFRDIL